MRRATALFAVNSMFAFLAGRLARRLLSLFDLMAFFDEFAFPLSPFLPPEATGFFNRHTAGLFFVFRRVVLFFRHETFFHARKAPHMGSSLQKQRLVMASMDAHVSKNHCNGSGRLL